MDPLARIAVAPIKEWSGHDVISHPTIAHLRNGRFRIVNRTVSGDAPKDFLEIYEHGKGHKAFGYHLRPILAMFLAPNED